MFAVTGLGAVSALGSGCDSLWRGVEAGRDGMAPIARFDTTDYNVSIAATIPAYRDVQIEDLPAGFRLCLQVALEAAREAWQQAALDENSTEPRTDIDRTRIGVVLGTLFVDATNSEGSLSAHELTESVADALNARGPRITVATACASSANAIGLAGDLIRMGSADIVLAGGVDLLNNLVFAGFHALSVLSPSTCAPFSSPAGTVLGEGAGFLVLERAEHAARRAVEAKSWILGYGLSSDAYHETSPDPTGRGVERALRNALDNARIPADKIAYVNAHGTGTAKNDMAEWRGFRRVFGGRASDVLMSSSKSFLGHAQGAAGALELITTILGMQRAMVPPTMHFSEPRRLGPVDPVAQATPRSACVPFAASVNAGFGGSNAAVVVGVRAHLVPDSSTASTPVPSVNERTPIRILGIGAVGGHGIGVASLMDALEYDRNASGSVPPFQLSDVGLVGSQRRIDPVSRYLSAAGALAIRDSGVRINKQLRDRAGLIAGITRLSPQSVGELNRSIDARGMHRLSATAFPRMLLNAPGGACSRLLELRGPISTVSIGRGSGLLAIVYAIDLLARNRDADVLLAGGADELEHGKQPAHSGEGGACVLLSSLPMAQIPTRTMTAPTAIEVLGWAISGPGRGSEVAVQAIECANIDCDSVTRIYRASHGLQCNSAADIEVIDVTTVIGDSECAASAAAVVAAVGALRRGDTDTVLVVDDQGQSSSCALVLSRHEIGTEPLPSRMKQHE